MKPDTYFRHSGRPPCTHDDTDASGSESPLTSSDRATDDASGHAITLEAKECYGEITLRGESHMPHGLTPACVKRKGRPGKSPSHD